ncbi:magnesium transporter MgtE N-terminal domain-containing protein [Elioraea tepidiphila]|uniref:MotE family protein n=1 Tax=Elioraea tepidiphila TaxID=457934 RepID=UPI002FD9E87C
MTPAPSRRGHARLLPFVIVTLAALLTVRVAALLIGVPFAPAPEGAVGLPIVPSALAARGEAEAPPAVQQAARTDRPAAVPAVPPADGSAPTAPRFAQPSAAEMTVLEDLRARRLALEERERTIAEREAVVVAAERRLAERIEELQQLQQRLEALDQAARERTDAGWRGLVKIYETMRPRDAARIFNELEMPVLIEVVERMRERNAAPILAGMNPDKAKALTAELAQRRARSPDEGSAGG